MLPSRKNEIIIERIIMSIDDEIENKTITRIMEKIVKNIEFYETFCIIMDDNTETTILQYDDISSFRIGVSNDRDVIYEIDIIVKNIERDDFYLLTICKDNDLLLYKQYNEKSINFLRKIRFAILNLFKPHIIANTTTNRHDMIKLLKSIEDKLQAIVFAPESSLFKEIQEERKELMK